MRRAFSKQPFNENWKGVASFPSGISADLHVRYLKRDGQKAVEQNGVKERNVLKTFLCALFLLKLKKNVFCVVEVIILRNTYNLLLVYYDSIRNITCIIFELV